MMSKASGKMNIINSAANPYSWQPSTSDSSELQPSFSLCSHPQHLLIQNCPLI